VRTNNQENTLNKSINSRYWLPALAASLLAAPPAFSGGSAAVHKYTISVDYSMTRLWVEARFASPVTSFTARSRAAGKFLIDVRGCNSDQSIRLRNNRMMLPESGIRCINYTVDLAKASRFDRRYRDLAPDNIVASPALWLWRPEITRHSEILARLRLPNDVRASVPWQALDSAEQTYRLTRSPESADAPVAFGKFDYRDIKVSGATLTVSLLHGKKAIDQRAVLNWIQANANGISQVYGRFPNPAPQILVVPTSGVRGDTEAIYGEVIRNGGDTVQLFINPEKSLKALMSDPTVAHDFSHLMLPYLNLRNQWISEGFAQYYQNVFLARSGIYDAQHSWQKLYEGFELGRRSRPELSPNEASEGGVRTGLMKMYWSGAAIALMADVELRKHSVGTESLDTVLGRLQRCCLPANRMWSGIELFEKLDSLSDDPVFMPLYRRYADTAGFPNTTELLARLGLSASNGKIRIRRNGELTRIRAAITQKQPPTIQPNRLAAR